LDPFPISCSSLPDEDVAKGERSYAQEVFTGSKYGRASPLDCLPSRTKSSRFET
jgi:hypothetical protein